MDYFQGKKILITGGAGYLAASIVYLLKDIECNIIRFDLKSPAKQTNCKATIEDITGDIKDPNIWEHLLKGTDIVFHFAAQTSVYIANDNPIKDISINVAPMINMLETCRNKQYKPTILFSGTVTEAGVPSSLPVNEKHPDNPITVYDIHKLMAEKYLRYYASIGIVRGVVLRLANVYGPGPTSSAADRGVLNIMIKKALKGEDITIYGKGEFIRDYIFVKDVAEAFLKAAISIDKTNRNYYVVGSGKGYTIAKAFNIVAERAALKTGKKVNVISTPPPPSLSPIESRNFISDSSAFRTSTGWEPRYTFEEGIDATIESMNK